MGARILDRFELSDRLGSGGFGTVYRAWDERLERHVAVKVIEADEGAGRRVLREAQAAARLNHPGIVTLYELGESDGQAYLVTELVDGLTLRQLSQRGSLSDREVGEVGADLCEALDHAHSRGVVHRDVKPQNVLVCEHEPQAKLMDFGIARVLDGARMTSSGDVVGTLAYMAPEQAHGRPAGPEADIYSLALTLYECWSGENPHARGTPAATVRAISAPLPSLARLRSDLPPALTEAVDRCLAPDPASRPTLSELGEAIEGSLNALSADRAPRAHRTSRLALLADRIATGGLTQLAAAAAVGGLTVAAMIAAGGVGPLWAWLLVPLATAAALLRPRIGYLVAAIGLVVWLDLAAARPGGALVLGLVTIPPALLVAGSGRTLPLPAAAPILAAAGAAPLYPLIAGLASRTRDRLVLGAAGYGWLAIAEVALDRRLLLGSDINAPHAWQGSAGEALTGILLPLATEPLFVLGLLSFATASALLGALTAPLLSRRIRVAAPASQNRLHPAG